MYIWCVHWISYFEAWEFCTNLIFVWTGVNTISVLLILHTFLGRAYTLAFNHFSRNWQMPFFSFIYRDGWANVWSYGHLNIENILVISVIYLCRLCNLKTIWDVFLKLNKFINRVMALAWCKYTGGAWCNVCSPFIRYLSIWNIAKECDPFHMGCFIDSVPLW